MNDQFERNLSATLRELSEEAVPVNLSEHALRGARRRVVLAAATTVAAAAIMIGAVPLAMAATGPGGGPASPADVKTVAPSGPISPVPPHSGPTSPVPPASGPTSPLPPASPSDVSTVAPSGPISPVPPASGPTSPVPLR